MMNAARSVTDATALEAHFKFGENWSDFAHSITHDEIERAGTSLARLVGSLKGKTFLDIGCGSGLHALAALKLGASHVTAIDIDPISVRTTRDVLSRFAPGQSWESHVVGVLSPGFASIGEFDVVYSWGVLHHTGAMWKAVDAASSRVKSGGLLALALYRRSLTCSAWKIEKRIYSRAPAPVQTAMRGVFKAVFYAALIAAGKSPTDYFAAYSTNRGMNWHHDIHDWLGGYPYESTTPEKVAARLKGLGLVPVSTFNWTPPAGGLLGVPCFEQTLYKMP